jgi:dTDP-4-dehydrorhamnose reductase
MLRLMEGKESISVVADQQGSPTRARDLAAAILRIVTTEKPLYGVFHYSNEGTCSWYEFAKAIQRIGLEEDVLEKKCAILPVTTDEYPTKAQRPAWSVLSKEKIKGSYGVEVPGWEESLGRFLNGYGAKKDN